MMWSVLFKYCCQLFCHLWPSTVECNCQPATHFVQGCRQWADGSFRPTHEGTWWSESCGQESRWSPTINVWLCPLVEHRVGEYHGSFGHCSIQRHIAHCSPLSLWWRLLACSWYLVSILFFSTENCDSCEHLNLTSFLYIMNCMAVWGEGVHQIILLRSH